MLLAREWAFTHVGVLVWRFDPVPLAVAVSVQAKVSLSAVESGPLPPKMTIMPFALPVLHTLALC